MSRNGLCDGDALGTASVYFNTLSSMSPKTRAMRFVRGVVVREAKSGRSEINLSACDNVNRDH